MLQADLERLMDWSNRWQMQFNIEKCKVMHFGYNNPCLEYTMGEEKLMMTESEKRSWCCDPLHTKTCSTYS